MANAERAEVVALDPLEMLLDAARYAEGNVGGGSNPAWAKAARAAVAKARLAAPDQKPVAWRMTWIDGSHTFYPPTWTSPKVMPGQ